MKKYFSLAAFAFAAIALVSCNKEGDGKNNGGNEDEGQTSRKVLISLASSVTEEGTIESGRTFRYNEDGSLAGVDEVWTNDDGSLGTWNLNATWSGSKVTFTTDEGDVEYEFTLGSNGYVSSRADGETTYTYEYDAEGHLTTIKENGTVCSIITWENGNLTSWSKENEIPDADGNYTIARVKKQTYTTDPNTGGIHTVFSEKSSLKKWMFEAGLFGVASKNLVATDKWETTAKGEPMTDGAKFEYRTDDDDYVIAEVKYYGNTTDGYELDDESYYIWEE